MVTMRFPFIFVIGLLIVLSCAKGNEPVAPSSAPELSPQNTEISSGRVCWGLWDVILNPDSLTADVVPLRGLNFTANVLNFLQPPKAPIDLLTIKIDPDKTDFSNQYIECDVTLKHPFPGTKFCGFDVMGIIMDDWDPAILSGDPSTYLSFPPETLLQNPDGWTRWWNPDQFTTHGTIFGYIEGNHAPPDWPYGPVHTINAFKYFADDLEPNDVFDPQYETRGFFSSDNPGLNTRRYRLQFPSAPPPIYIFKYAISANWVAPLPDAEPPYTADDFPPEANMPEAYRIGIINNGSTAYYENEQSYGGDLNLIVAVRDRQLTGDPSKITDEIKSVTIHSPTLFSNFIDLDLSQAYFPNDNPTLVYIPVTINDVWPVSYENQLLLIMVKSAHPTTYEPQIPGITGFEYPINELTAFNIVEAPIIHIGAESVWPTYRKDNARSGRADVEGPITYHKKFTFDVPGGSRSGIVIDGQGRAIFNSENGIVYCVDSDGSLAWSFDEDCIGYNYPAATVGSDDSIFIGDSCGNFRHLNAFGELIWSRDNSKYGEIDGGNVVQADGTILFGTWGGYIVKIDSDGDEIWNYPCGNAIPGGPVVGKDGTIYFASYGDIVYAIDQDGGLIWSTDCGNDDMTASPALGPNGIYIGSESFWFYCLDYNGGIVWSKQLINSFGSPASVGSNGNAYVVDYNSTLFCFDQISGDEKWSVQFLGSWCCPAPVTDSENRVYFGAPSGIVHCVSPDGDILWSSPWDDLDGFNAKSPAISDDGTLFLVSNVGYLFAFDNG